MNFLEENTKQIITSEQPILSEVLIRKTFTGSEFKLSLIARIYTSDLLQTNSRSLEITLSLYSFFHKLLAYSLPRIRSWGVGWGVLITLPVRRRVIQLSQKRLHGRL